MQPGVFYWTLGQDTNGADVFGLAFKSAGCCGLVGPMGGCGLGFLREDSDMDMNALAMRVFAVGIVAGLTGFLSLVLGYATEYSMWTDTKLVSALVMFIGFAVAWVAWRVK